MSLAREVAKKGVTVNAVAPGFIETDMLKDVPDAALDQVKAMTPMGRLGKAGGNRRCDRLSGQPACQLHHRTGAGGERRNVHVMAVI